MRAMNETLGTKFLTQLEGLADGRVALATIDENDRRCNEELKLKMEAASKSIPMEISEGLDLQQNQPSL